MNNNESIKCNTNRIQNSAVLVNLTQLGGNKKGGHKTGRPVYKCRHSHSQNPFYSKKCAFVCFQSKIKV